MPSPSSTDTVAARVLATTTSGTASRFRSPIAMYPGVLPVPKAPPGRKVGTHQAVPDQAISTTRTDITIRTPPWWRAPPFGNRPNHWPTLHLLEKTGVSRRTGKQP